MEAADRAIAALLDRVCGAPVQEMAGRPILAGNSVHNDWLLMRRFMPAVSARLHYRLLDVSGLKVNMMDWGDTAPFDKEDLELVRRYGPDSGLDALNAHDAHFDIIASIAELAFYREKMRVAGA